MIVLKKDSKKKLASHVVLTLVLGFACQSMTHAAEHSTVYVSGGGKQMFEVLYYNQGDALYLDPNKSKRMKIISSLALPAIICLLSRKPPWKKGCPTGRKCWGRGRKTRLLYKSW